MGQDTLRPMRRIVTIEGPDGASVIAADTLLPPGRTVAPGVSAAHIWATAAAPVAYVADDGSSLLQGTPPPPGGSRIGVLDLAPGAQAGPLHRTDTVDYGICVEGEIDLVLPEGRETLKAGDTVIQCGATHTWENRSAAPARLIFVMIDAEPKRAGSVGAAARV